MMREIEQVLEFYHELASRPAGFPGNLLSLRAVPMGRMDSSLGLPKSYINFVSKHVVEEVSLGALELTPLPAESLSESLVKVNGSNKSPHFGDGFIHVANFEGDLVLVMKGDHGHDDSRVFYNDISTGLFRGPVCIASDFETFVLIAANLDRQMIEKHDVDSETFADVAKSIDPYLGEEGIRCWQDIAEALA